MRLVKSEEGAPHRWVYRVLLLVAVALTLGPLVRAGAAVFGPHEWRLTDRDEFFFMTWLFEMTAAIGSAPLVWRLKDARKRGVTRMRAELFVARLAFWIALLFSLGLPCAFVMAFHPGS